MYPAAASSVSGLSVSSANLGVLQNSRLFKIFKIFKFIQVYSRREFDRLSKFRQEIKINQVGSLTPCQTPVLAALTGGFEACRAGQLDFRLTGWQTRNQDFFHPVKLNLIILP